MDALVCLELRILMYLYMCMRVCAKGQKELACTCGKKKHGSLFLKRRHIMGSGRRMCLPRRILDVCASRRKRGGFLGGLDGRSDDPTIE